MSDTTWLPCPFCASSHIDREAIRDGMAVYCRGCGASVRAYNPGSLEAATKKWNLRQEPRATVTDLGAITKRAHALEERLSRLEAVVEALTAPPPSPEVMALRQVVRNALSFTYPRHDAAMWRVAAIEALPEAERERFRDLLAGQHRGSL